MSKNLRCYDYVNRPYHLVRDALVKGALDIFRAATRAASSRTREAAAELRVNLGPVEVGAEIAIEVVRVEERDPGPMRSPVTTLEIEWKAVRSSRLFPLMRAEFSVYSLTGTETQIDFHGTYDPPLGVLGDAMDAIVGCRIAELAVHGFVNDVASYLRESLPNATSCC